MKVRVHPVYSLLQMHRLFAAIVLAAVSFNAMWCLDGCVDPFASNGAFSQPAGPASSDAPEERTCCVVCITPFQKESPVVLAPTWGFGVPIVVFRAVDPPLAPPDRIDHPPRVI